MKKKTLLEVIIVAAFAIALCLIAVILISVFGGSKTGKSTSIPLLCGEPVYPETIQAKDGEYVRKLSTYWWVQDVKNGKVIIKDPNKTKGGITTDHDTGVADFRGRITVPCEFMEVYFTSNGYIMAGNPNPSEISFFNMGGNCLDTFNMSYSQIPGEAKAEYGERTTSTAESDHASPENNDYALSEQPDGNVKYFGKYITISEPPKVSTNKNEKTNTCIYEFKAKKE